MKHAEDKLLTLLTPAEQQKILRLKAQASPLEIIEAESGLNAWENSIQSTDKKLSNKLQYVVEDSGKDLHRIPIVKAKNIPPVRGVPVDSGSTLPGVKNVLGTVLKSSGERSDDSADLSYRLRISGDKHFTADSVYSKPSAANYYRFI